MSKLLRVATIGSKPLKIAEETPPLDVVGRIIEYWQKKLDQVLPDSPDLIVLPEACDRPDGYSREKLSMLKAYYGCKVKIHDPGFIGSVLITSLHEDLTVVDMTKKFDIELLDDYINRALIHRHRTGDMES